MMGDAAGESEAWASAGLCVGEGGGGCQGRMGKREDGEERGMER